MAYSYLYLDTEIRKTQRERGVIVAVLAEEFMLDLRETRQSLLLYVLHGACQIKNNGEVFHGGF
jgi:hypothetical protein